MLAGRLPFEGETGFEMSSAILQKCAEPLPSNVPVELRTVVERCLEKEPRGRYQNGGELRLAFEALQSGRVSALGGIRYRVSRRRWLVTVAALLVLAMTAGLILARLRTRSASAPMIAPGLGPKRSCIRPATTRHIVVNTIRIVKTHEV